jgi:hypothetical protein
MISIIASSHNLAPIHKARTCAHLNGSNAPNQDSHCAASRRDYQTYFAARAITTIVKIANAAIWSQKSLARPLLLVI